MGLLSPGRPGISGLRLLFLSPPSGSTYTPSEAGNALDLELGAEEADEESGGGGSEGKAEETSTMEEDRCGRGCGGCSRGPQLWSLEWVGQIRVLCLVWVVPPEVLLCANFCLGFQ